MQHVRDHCKLPYRVRKHRGQIRICECGKLWTPHRCGYAEMWMWKEVTIEIGGIGAVVNTKGCC